MKLWTHYNRWFSISFRLKNPWHRRKPQYQNIPEDERCVAKTTRGTRCKRRRSKSKWTWDCPKHCDQHHRKLCGVGWGSHRDAEVRTVETVATGDLPDDPAEWLASLGPDDD